MKKTLLLLLAVVFCGTAQAQSNDSLVVLFLSQPGVRPSQIFTDGFESGDVSRFDATGDGTVDLILQRDDSQGNLQALRVLDGRTRAVFWEVLDVAALNITRGEVGTGDKILIGGFAAPLDADTPYALFVVRDDSGADVGVALIDPRDNSLAFRTLAPSILQGVADLTNDGLPELILFLPDTKQVQVWGKAD